jgi:hypothetical protein
VSSVCVRTSMMSLTGGSSSIGRSATVSIGVVPSTRADPSTRAALSSACASGPSSVVRRCMGEASATVSSFRGASSFATSSPSPGVLPEKLAFVLAEMVAVCARAVALGVRCAVVEHGLGPFQALLGRAHPGAAGQLAGCHLEHDVTGEGVLAQSIG